MPRRMKDSGAPVGAAAMKINKNLSTVATANTNNYIIGSIVKPIFIDIAGKQYWNGKAIVRLVTEANNEEKEAFVSNVMLGTGVINIRPPVRGQQCLVKPVTIGSDTVYQVITFMSTAISGDKPIDKLASKGVPQVNAGEVLFSSSDATGAHTACVVYMSNDGSITIKNMGGNSILSLGNPKMSALSKAPEGNIGYALDIGNNYHKSITSDGKVVESVLDDYTLNTENIKYSITEDITLNGKNLISRIMDTIKLTVKSIVLKVYRDVSQTIFGSLNTIVHSDKTEDIRGNSNESVVGNKQTNIQGNEQEDIGGEASKNVSGVCSVNGEEIKLNGDVPVACKGHKTETTVVCPVLGVKIHGQIIEGSSTVKAEK